MISISVDVTTASVVVDVSIVVTGVGVDSVSDSVGCGSGSGWACICSCGVTVPQSSQTPGVPRSVTPDFIPMVVVAVIHPPLKRIMVVLIGKLDPAGGTPPVPTESMTVPVGSRRSICNLALESETDVVTKCVVVARTLLASPIA